MKIDPQKINKKIEELKKDGGEWIEIPGLHSLPSVQLDKEDNKPTFVPSAGLIIKSFINVDKGLIRSYPAFLFEVGEIIPEESNANETSTVSPIDDSNAT